MPRDPSSPAPSSPRRTSSTRRPIRTTGCLRPHRHHLIYYRPQSASTTTSFIRSIDESSLSIPSISNNPKEQSSTIHSPAVIFRSTILPWYIEISEDYEPRDVPEVGTWFVLFAAHRDPLPGPSSPSSLQNMLDC